VLNFEHSFVGAGTWTSRKVDKKYPKKFLSVVLKKEGKIKVDRSCDKLRNITQIKEGEKSYKQ
jgi:hypothetical protein